MLKINPQLLNNCYRETKIKPWPICKWGKAMDITGGILEEDKVFMFRCPVLDNPFLSIEESMNHELTAIEK